MGLIKYITSSFLVTLFALAVISFAIGFGSDNNVAVDISDDTDITGARTDIITDLSDQRTSVANSSLAFAQSSIESGDETSATGGVFKSLSSVYNSLKTSLNLIKNKLLGGEQGSSGIGLVLSIVATLLLILAILYVWKTWAGKTPD